jgi:protein-S-isoprenylcysteine O-methyltransferase Ste14
MSDKGAVPLRTILRALMIVVVMPFLPLLISRHWAWWEAWAYGAISVAGLAVSRLLAARRHPDLVAERAQATTHENTKAWDRTLMAWLMLVSLVVMIVAGLDALLGWTRPYGWGPRVLALVLLVTGYALSSYALLENRFFSAVVRIQTDRGHVVVSGGPYRWVRHPGYAGGLLAYLATPLLLGTLWAYLPTALVVVLVLRRTRREDATLQEELPGYRGYATRTRYRLLPGVW